MAADGARTAPPPAASPAAGAAPVTARAAMDLRRALQLGLAAVWLLVFALMPLFNQDRLRCGDLVAGTLVVKMPAAVLRLRRRPWAWAWAPASSSQSAYNDTSAPAPGDDRRMPCAG